MLNKRILANLHWIQNDILENGLYGHLIRACKHFGCSRQYIAYLINTYSTWFDSLRTPTFDTEYFTCRICDMEQPIDRRAEGRNRVCLDCSREHLHKCILCSGVYRSTLKAYLNRCPECNCKVSNETVRKKRLVDAKYDAKKKEQTRRYWREFQERKCKSLIINKLVNV